MSLFSKRPLALFSLFLSLSSLISFLLASRGTTQAFLWVPLCLFLALSILFLFRRQKKSLLLFCLAVAMLLGALSQALYRDRRHTPLLALDAGAPHSMTATVLGVHSETAKETVYSVSVTSLDGKPETLRLLLRTAEGELDSVSAIDATVTVLSYATPYEYARGYAGTVALTVFTVLEVDSPRGLSAALAELRSFLGERIGRGLSEGSAALYNALLLGNREALTSDVSTAFLRAGLTHTLALSGLHLTVLALLFRRLLSLLRLPNPVSFFLLVLFLGLYGAIAGFPLSLVRAAIMLTIFELGKLLRLFSDSVTSLFVSLALILFLAPGSALDVGLWLSFLATLGILTASELIEKKKRRFLLRLLFAVYESLLFSLLAILSTMLLSVFLFGGVSLVAPLANLAASPIVHLALLLAPLLLLPLPLAPIAEAVADAFLFVARTLGGWRGVYISADYALFLAVLSVFSLFFLVLLLVKVKSKLTFSLSLLSASAILIGVLLGCHLVTKGRDAFLYTKQPSAEYLILRKDGKVSVMIHADTSGAATRLRSALLSLHITEIDTLVLTDCKEESSAQLTVIAAELPVRRLVLFSQREGAGAAASEVLSEADALSIPTETHAYTSQLQDGVSLTVFSRDKEWINGTLLRLEVAGEPILYATPSMLSGMGKEAASAFLRDASLLILAPDPDFEASISYFAVPPHCTVIYSDPDHLPKGSDTGMTRYHPLNTYATFFLPLERAK